MKELSRLVHRSFHIIPRQEDFRPLALGASGRTIVRIHFGGRKTVILISHRLANVVDSDCIYVLDKGRIAERGTHAELLKKQGAYSRLYTAQKQLETLETEDA